MVIDFSMKSNSDGYYFYHYSLIEPKSMLFKDRTRHSTGFKLTNYRLSGLCSSPEFKLYNTKQDFVLMFDRKIFRAFALHFRKVKISNPGQH